ncbi:hypothetical protein BDB00DRAFT_810441 [Zychaea mexicana]|uniref:uncharacterized protein n=1 Tax=Zychaea mexicana TaxID=64656 RepID=UPI0022FF0689|nr:uncharacterized protein BDB00DRAFT_810441 [Zychaea mexicana]KAI9496088.1 hypothetical protein BDB00DRAFT_810441 [Zychaea mexicana]
MERFLNPVKQTYESASLSTLIFLELFLFAVCLHWCLPQRHRQARTIKLATSTDHVWTILLDIHRYPLWRSHVVSVQPLLGSQHLEHVARTRQHLEHKQQNYHQEQTNPALFYKTRVRAIDMNRVNDSTLIRIDRATRISSCTPPPSPPPEEACTNISDGKQVPTLQQQQQQQLKFPKSSFEREWEIHVRPSDDGYTLLTLVETVRSEGYLARWLGPIFGGFHRVSQRFLLDLVREVDRQQKQRVLHNQTLCESPVSLQHSHQKRHVLNEVYSTVTV